jgi:hypothetical protein
MPPPAASTATPASTPTLPVLSCAPLALLVQSVQPPLASAPPVPVVILPTRELHLVTFSAPTTHTPVPPLTVFVPLARPAPLPSPQPEPAPSVPQELTSLELLALPALLVPLPLLVPQAVLSARITSTPTLAPAVSALPAPLALSPTLLSLVASSALLATTHSTTLACFAPMVPPPWLAPPPSPAVCPVTLLRSAAPLPAVFAPTVLLALFPTPLELLALLALQVLTRTEPLALFVLLVQPRLLLVLRLVRLAPLERSRTPPLLVSARLALLVRSPTLSKTVASLALLDTTSLVLCV